MHCVTETEISDWLGERSLPEDPYHHPIPGHYFQFRVPETHHRLDALIRHYYQRIIPCSETLVHMTDWGLYRQSEMIAITSIRAAIGEGRPLIEAPGHCLDSAEHEFGVSLFSLAASFHWSAYLYSPHARSILFNWEGDIFDFWTASLASDVQMRKLLQEFGLSVISG